MARKPYFQYELVGKNNRILKDGDNFDKASKFNLYYKDEIVLKNEPFPKRIKSANAKSNYIYKSKENIKAYIKQVEKELARQLLEESKKEKIQKEKIKKEIMSKEKTKKKEIEEIIIEDKKIKDEISKKKKKKPKLMESSDIEIVEEFEKEFEDLEKQETLIWFKEGIVYFNWKKVSLSQFIDILAMNRNIDDISLHNYYKKNLSKISFEGDIKNYRVPYVKNKGAFNEYSNVFFQNNYFLPLRKSFLNNSIYPETSKLIDSLLLSMVEHCHSELRTIISFSRDSELNASFHFPFFSLENGKVVNSKLLSQGYEDLYENSISSDYLLPSQEFERYFKKIFSSFLDKLPQTIERDNYTINSSSDAIGIYLSGISFHISHRDYA